MKNLLVFIFLFSKPIYSFNLNITINNQNLSGKCYIALFKGEKGFLKKEHAFKGAKFNLEKNRTKYTFQNLPAGEYAYVAFHDKNNNGILDTNFFKAPIEATGFSNNFRPKFIPNYNDFKFKVSKDIFQTIDLK
ncbi:MAG: DUF2141 domain-containing protein [Cetobacterium sp.]